MKRRRIGEVAKEVLQSMEENAVTMGHHSLLHKIYDAMGYTTTKRNHPLTRIKRVADALHRDCKRPGAAMRQYYGRWTASTNLSRGWWIAGTEPASWVKPSTECACCGQDYRQPLNDGLCLYCQCCGHCEDSPRCIRLGCVNPCGDKPGPAAAEELRRRSTLEGSRP